jgi:hypothetical protein
MLTIPKNSLKRALFFGLIAFFYLTMIQWYLEYPISQAQEQEIKNTIKSPEAEQERWLSQWRDNAEKDQLYRYAVKLFKAPVDCEAKITNTFEGNHFGTLLFIFTGDAELKLETFPPESSRITLRAPNGFPNKREACYVLEQYVRKIGVGLDWSKPKQQKNGAELIKSFHPFDPELNATAIQVYKNKKLVEIGFNMAL